MDFNSNLRNGHKIYKIYYSICINSLSIDNGFIYLTAVFNIHIITLILYINYIYILITLNIIY